MPIPDRYEIVLGQKLVGGIIYGVEYLILATKKEMIAEMVFIGGVCVVALGL